MKEFYSKIILKKRTLSERSIKEVLEDKKFVKIEDLEKNVVAQGLLLKKQKQKNKTIVTTHHHPKRIPNSPHPLFLSPCLFPPHNRRKRSNNSRVSGRSIMVYCWCYCLQITSKTHLNRYFLPFPFFLSPFFLPPPSPSPLSSSPFPPSTQIKNSWCGKSVI